MSAAIPEQPVLVSTVIATRDRARLLEQAIASALAQDVEGHEVIVVDDGSTDETTEVVGRYPVRYLRLGDDAGGTPSRARNAGIRAARGRYIAFLDDDDVWLPNRLRAALDVMEREPEIGMTFGQAQPVDERLRPFGRPFPPLPQGTSRAQIVAALLDATVHLNTVLVRRSVFEFVGLLDESVYGAEDMDLTVRIARRFRCAALAGPPVAFVRFHPRGPVTETAVEGFWRRRSDEMRLLRRHLGKRASVRPGPVRRWRIVVRKRGWYASVFLDLAARCREAGPSAGANAARKRALRYALRTSPGHALKSPRFWRAALAFAGGGPR
jgi:glycosyltransferase involved in cell wall biosynthesis